MLRGLTKEEADTVFEKLRAGISIRVMAQPPMRLSVIRLVNHKNQNPEWAAEFELLSKAQRTASNYKRMEWKRNKTHCVHGHEYTLENTSFQSDGTRQCKTCNRASAAMGKVLSDAEVQSIKTKLTAGIPLGWIAGSSGPDQSHYVANFAAVNRKRREDPEFNQFVAEAISGAHARGQKRRAARILINRRRQEAEDYAAIRSMVPLNIPHRDDVVGSIYRAMLEGTVKREDVRSVVQFFIRAEYKFVHNPWRDIGFDAPVRAGSEFKLSDVIAENRWD